MEVELAVPVAADISLIEKEYSDLYFDAAYDGTSHYFIGSSDDDQRSEKAEISSRLADAVSSRDVLRSSLSLIVSRSLCQASIISTATGPRIQHCGTGEAEGIAAFPLLEESTGE